MKLQKTWFLIAAIFMFCGAPIANAEAKVAVINLQKVFDDSNEAAKEREKLKNSEDYKALIANIKKLDASIVNGVKDLEKNNVTWSDKKKKEKVDEINQKQQQLNGLLNQRTELRKKLANSIKKKVGSKVEDIVNNMVDKEDITILLPVEGVLFYKESIDITQKVLSELNKAK